jgi:ribonucleoside-diphosphate reductase alpha subunit
MFVINRQNNKEIVSFDKILERIRLLSAPINNVNIDCGLVAQKIVGSMYSGITTTKLDELSARICMGMFSDEPGYGDLAVNICINNLHKNTSDCLLETYSRLYNISDESGNKFNLVSKELLEIIAANIDKLNKIIDYNLDYKIDFFGFKTLERSYLLKVGNSEIIERPQHMFMRVALAIHGNDIDKVEKVYNMLANQYFTHATPTLFNAGTERPQMSSCFLAGMEDSIESIFETSAELAKISKWAGGIGLSISNIRSDGSLIRGTGGKSSGIMPLMKMLNSIATYINQGGKRNGSFAIYLEPHHPDIFTFLDAKKNHGADEIRARDLFYALWVSDLFMQRVKKNENWSLLCPDTCKGLGDVYGEEFKTLYEKYESDSRIPKKIVKARDVWSAILSSQIETGGPYILYKDACNKKSNQKNIGVIRSSNLCAEIIQYSDSKETAVCNLASICLPRFLEEKINESYMNTFDGLRLKSSIEKYTNVCIYTKDDCVYCKLLKVFFTKVGIVYKEITKEEDDVLKIKFLNNDFKTVPRVYNDDEYLGGYQEAYTILKPKVNYQKLADVSGMLVENLNNIIDSNFYPTEKTRLSNSRHRPMGIGVQGLADIFIKLRISFDSDEATELNKKLFETIYYGAMKSSIELSKKNGAYESFQGSPLSEGKFQFDLWDFKEKDLSGFWDWDILRKDVIEYGARNSLLIAIMPTASTSQIMGNNECIEPYTSNLYVRRTIAGEFTVVNKHLVNDLISIGLWDNNTRDRLLYDRGSVKNIKNMPEFLKDVYKTVWEIKQKKCIDLSADRAPFVCQSQSLNIWLESPTFDSLTSIHFYGWSRGLKTGSYYIRSKPKVNPKNFSMTVMTEKKMMEENKECESCSG